MEDFNVRQSILYMRAARAVDHLFTLLSVYFTLVIFTFYPSGTPGSANGFVQPIAIQT